MLSFSQTKVAQQHVAAGCLLHPISLSSFQASWINHVCEVVSSSSFQSQDQLAVYHQWQQQQLLDTSDLNKFKQPLNTFWRVKITFSVLNPIATLHRVSRWSVNLDTMASGVLNDPGEPPEPEPEISSIDEVSGRRQCHVGKVELTNKYL